MIYVPVIASEERFLRATFPEFEAYCRRVPRLIPRLTHCSQSQKDQSAARRSFSFALYAGTASTMLL